MFEKLLIALRLKKKPEPKPAPAIAEPRRNYPPVGSRIPVAPPRRSYIAPPVAQPTADTDSEMANAVLMYSLLNSSSHASECRAPKAPEPYRGGGGESGGAGASGGWEPSPSYDSGSSYSSSSGDCGSSDSGSSGSCSSD